MGSQNIPLAPRPAVAGKCGDEMIHDGKRQIDGKTVLEFWRWSFSNLLQPLARGVFAEYLVALAVGQADGLMNAFGAIDFTLGSLRIQVKSSAYLNTNARRAAFARTSFSVKKKRGFTDEGLPLGNAPMRWADLYVFALLKHRDVSTLDPLNVSQWEFFVVPTAKIVASHGEEVETLSLRQVQALCPESCSFGDLLFTTIGRVGREAGIETARGPR